MTSSFRVFDLPVLDDGITTTDAVDAAVSLILGIEDGLAVDRDVASLSDKESSDPIPGVLSASDTESSEIALADAVSVIPRKIDGLFMDRGVGLVALSDPSDKELSESSDKEEPSKIKVWVVELNRIMLISARVVALKISDIIIVIIIGFFEENRIDLIE